MHCPEGFTTHVLTRQQLCCVRSCLETRLDKEKRQYSATLLQRLARKQPLWNPPHDTSPLDTLKQQFYSLQDQNLKSCQSQLESLQAIEKVLIHLQLLKYLT